MSDATMFAPLAQYSSRDFAERYRSIWVFTRERAIELEVFAADVADASSEGKHTDFANAAELDATSETNCPDARSSWKSRRMSPKLRPS